MTIIKGTTKRGQDMAIRAKHYEGYSLHDVYDNYSDAKINAWGYCLRLCSVENGLNFHICSHNTFGFSVAWEVENGIRIETPKNSYLILWPKNC